MSDIIEWVLEMRVQDGQANKVQPLLDEMATRQKRMNRVRYIMNFT